MFQEDKISPNKFIHNLIEVADDFQENYPDTEEFILPLKAREAICIFKAARTKGYEYLTNEGYQELDSISSHESLKARIDNLKFGRITLKTDHISIDQIKKAF